MNQTIAIGRLTADPVVRYSANTQNAIAKFTLAVDRMGKDKEADFLRFTAFGKQAETLEKYVGKGCRLAVTGHSQTGKFQNQEGETIYTTDIIVDRFDIIDWKDNGGKSANNPASEFEAIDAELPF